MDNKEKKPTTTLQCDIKLPSSHPFRSSEEIESNVTKTHHITHQSSKQYPISLHNQWPHSCIGLVLCEHNYNNQTFYVYGTGILIHERIVLTSAQNVYCRRLNAQYTNIRFIAGVNGNKCSGIYDVMRVYYPNEYKLKEYQNYNFAVLQLYDDLCKSCGYVGWKTYYKPASKKLIAYGYINENEEGLFKLQQILNIEKPQQDWKYYSGSGLLVNQNDIYSIVAIHNSARTKGFIRLSDKTRNTINQWTHLTYIDLTRNKIEAQGCKYLSQGKFTHLNQIDLSWNNIDVQGCKYLIQPSWTDLTKINLSYNNIGALGCKYLTQPNWAQLSAIYLTENNVGAQGCKYLRQGKWRHLTTIDLNYNKIGAQGCKYLGQGKWNHLTQIDLKWNNIDTYGCKYLSQINWINLTKINLSYNNIDAQGCKYLIQANWPFLSTIDLKNNTIDIKGGKYLIQANWTQLTNISLQNNNINELIYILLQQSYPNCNKI